ELLAEFWYFRALGHLHMASVRHMKWLAEKLGLTLRRYEILSHYDAKIPGDWLARLRLWAYAVTHLAPASASSRIRRALPVVRRAASWDNAPAVTGSSDHIVAILAKGAQP